VTGSPFALAAIALLGAAPKADPTWLQWRGPRRDGICDERGLLKEWPEKGPPVLWTAEGLGKGWSSPIIAGGKAFITGDVGDDLEIFALGLSQDPSGENAARILWRSKNGRSWKGAYPGARACVAWDDGRIYHRNAHGRVACLDAESGKEIWAVDALERFEGKNITWALAECLLVDGPRVFVTAGGRKGLVAALDKRTGATLWTSEPLWAGSEDGSATRADEDPAAVDRREAESAGYASPIIAEVAGRGIFLSYSHDHAFGVDADSGKLLFARPAPTPYSVLVMTPVVSGDLVFLTAPYLEYGGLFRIVVEGSKVSKVSKVRTEDVWKTEHDTCLGGAIHVDGILYGSWYRRERGWVGLDWKTGEVRRQTREIAQGSGLYADGRIYCLSQEGEAALLEPSGNGFRFAGRFRLTPSRVSDAWAHPVIAGGRLYLRYHERLYCYDVRAVEKRAPVEATEL
jgi:outer membrane protein assembly factor BamB